MSLKALKVRNKDFPHGLSFGLWGGGDVGNEASKKWTLPRQKTVLIDRFRNHNLWSLKLSVKNSFLVSLRPINFH